MASPNELPKRGDIIASKYLIEGTLGTGGMGAVFEVSHRVTGKRFAVKWLLPALTTEADAVKRFIREAQVAGRVDHPNIVEVYDVGQDGDSFFMVMELLQGEALASLLAREGKLTPTQACRLLIPVMSGLAAAHAAGIIHRDLKPDNIFVCHSSSGVPLPKVLDFGISKMSNLAGEVTSSITRSGTVMGTPHYMAPEQIRALPLDGRTDVYALGVILYEMLSGALPFPGDTYSDLVLKIITETPKPLSVLAPGTPQGLIQVVTKAMAREAADRFTDVTEMAQALQPYADGVVVDPRQRRSNPSTSGSASAVRTTPLTPLSTSSERARTGDLATGAEPSSKRRLVLGVAAASAIIAGGLILGRSLTQPPTQPPEHELAQPKAAAMGAGAKAHADLDTANDLPTPNTIRIGPEPKAEPTQQAKVADAGEPTVAHDPAAPPAVNNELGARPPQHTPAPTGHAHKHANDAPRGPSSPPEDSHPRPRVNYRSPGLSLDDF